MSDAGTAGMIGNVVFGGVIGVGVDATSGATLDLYPNPVRVTLKRKDVMKRPTHVKTVTKHGQTYKFGNMARTTAFAQQGADVHPTPST